jgi:hypothetical protein
MLANFLNPSSVGEKELSLEQGRWSLPYEIIIVGVYDDAPKPCGD